MKDLKKFRLIITGKIVRIDFYSPISPNGSSLYYKPSGELGSIDIINGKYNYSHLEVTDIKVSFVNIAENFEHKVLQTWKHVENRPIDLSKCKSKKSLGYFLKGNLYDSESWRSLTREDYDGNRGIIRSEKDFFVLSDLDFYSIAKKNKIGSNKKNYNYSILEHLERTSDYESEENNLRERVKTYVHQLNMELNKSKDSETQEKKTKDKKSDKKNSVKGISKKATAIAVAASMILSFLAGFSVSEIINKDPDQTFVDSLLEDFHIDKGISFVKQDKTN